MNRQRMVVILLVTFFVFYFFYPLFLKNNPTEETKPINIVNISEIVKHNHTTEEPEQGPNDVILYLVPKIESDLNNLLQSLNSLNNLRNWFFRDIIIFHSGDITPCIQSFINSRGPVGRRIVYYKVELAIFPPNFDPSSQDPNWTHDELARDPWGYYHMIRFWFKNIFQLPIMKTVRYYLRLDTDSVIDREPDLKVNLFKFMEEKKLVYLGNDYNLDCGKVVVGLKDVYTRYTNTIRGNWKNPTLQKKQRDQEISCNCDCIYGFFNNFEIGDVEFFRRDDVMNFTEYIDRTNGIYISRWGDAILRFLTIGMFATEQQLGQRSSSEDTKVDYTHGPSTHAYLPREKYDKDLKVLLDSNC